jgi:hypothetical protein
MRAQQQPTHHAPFLMPMRAQLGTMPFPVAGQRLAAYALDVAALRRDWEAALREGLRLSGGTWHR